MRVTKGHTGNRRSHHGVKAVRLSICSNCQAKHQRHQLCQECGFYRGKQILNRNIETAESSDNSEAETKQTEKE